jgi:hypothetical protein
VLEAEPATLAAQLAKARDGDTVRLAPGTYAGPIFLDKNHLTLEGAAPGVIFNGCRSVPATEFQPAPDRPGVFVWPLPAGVAEELHASAPSERPLPPWVFVDDHPLLPRRKPLVPAADAMCFAVVDNKLEICLGAPALPAAARIEVPVVRTLVSVSTGLEVTVRGIEFYRCAGAAVEVRSGFAKILDCRVTQCGAGFDLRSMALCAGNTLSLCDGDGIYAWGSVVLHGNLLVANNVGWAADSGDKERHAAIECALDSVAVQGNWILDHVPGPVSAGPQVKVFTHPQGPGILVTQGSRGSLVAGNVCARLPHAGVLVDRGSGTTVLANAIQDCAMGVVLDGARNSVVARDWLFDRGFFGWGTVNTARYAGFGLGYDAKGKPLKKPLESPRYGRQNLEGLCLWDAQDGTTTDNLVTGNLVQVSGRSVSVPLGENPTPRFLADVDAPRAPLFSNQLAANYYDRPDLDYKRPFARFGDQEMARIEDYQAASGWDVNAGYAQFTPRVLGLAPLWTIPGTALDTTTPVAGLYDPSVDTEDPEDPGWPMGWTEAGQGARCHWLAGNQAHSGRHCLEVAPKDIGDWGGWRMSVPVCPGTTMAAHLWLTTDNVAGPGGVLARLAFSDACGFPLAPTLLVGPGATPLLRKGSQPWTDVSAEAVVPEHAAWMHVELGVEQAVGTVRFDDIEVGLVKPVPPAFHRRPWLVEKPPPPPPVTKPGGGLPRPTPIWQLDRE